jgi:hypothetical protein
MRWVETLQENQQRLIWFLPELITILVALIVAVAKLQIYAHVTLSTIVENGTAITVPVCVPARYISS